MNAPGEQLRLLAIFHYVLGGLSGLFSLFPIIYITIGLAMVTGRFPGVASGPNPPEAFGWFFVVIGAVFMLIGLTYTVLLIIAGRSLARARHWMFCMVMAGLSCAFFPFGTVLGVFTIVGLSKPEVKALFPARMQTPGAA